VNAMELRMLRRVSWQILILGVCVVVVFWPTFCWMAERFDAHDSFYSHGWLIPVASAWLIWQRKATLARVPIAPSFGGLPLLITSLSIHLVANWLHIGFLSGFALLGVVMGLVWTWWGRPMLRALWFPLAFLVFMVPLPGVLLIAISFKMKLMAASLATQCLHLFHIPAVQAGSMIQVAGLSILVDDTCSGLRSLISLIALAVLWTSLMPPSSGHWQKLTVVAASVPIALATNMVRIIVLVLLSAIYGPQIAESFIHYGSGIVVFGLALVLLTWLTRVLQQWSPPSFGLGHSPSSS